MTVGRENCGAVVLKDEETPSSRAFFRLELGVGFIGGAGVEVAGASAFGGCDGSGVATDAFESASFEGAAPHATVRPVVPSTVASLPVSDSESSSRAKATYMADEPR